MSSHLENAKKYLQKAQNSLQQEEREGKVKTNEEILFNLAINHFTQKDVLQKMPPIMQELTTEIINSKGNSFKSGAYLTEIDYESSITFGLFPINFWHEDMRIKTGVAVCGKIIGAPPTIIKDIMKYRGKALIKGIPTTSSSGMQYPYIEISKNRLPPTVFTYKK